MKPLGIAGVTVTLFQIGADPAQAATRTIFATTVTDSKGCKPEGWGGKRSQPLLRSNAAIDYKTGQIRWSHKWPGGGGGVRSDLLRTAPLWHAALHVVVSNGPITKTRCAASLCEPGNQARRRRLSKPSTTNPPPTKEMETGSGFSTVLVWMPMS
jgi:hypothetical protein